MPLFNPGKALNKNWTTPGVGLTWKFLLLKGIWTPDVTLSFVSDLVTATNELSGGNYSRQAISTQTIAIDNGTGRANHLCANPSWANLTAADVRYLVAYQDSGSDASSPLHSYYDLGANAVTAATFTPQIPSGILFYGS